MRWLWLLQLWKSRISVLKLAELIWWAHCEGNLASQSHEASGAWRCLKQKYFLQLDVSRRAKDDNSSTSEMPSPTITVKGYIRPSLHTNILLWKVCWLYVLKLTDMVFSCKQVLTKASLSTQTVKRKMIKSSITGWSKLITPPRTNGMETRWKMFVSSDKEVTFYFLSTFLCMFVCLFTEKPLHKT